LLRTWDNKFDWWSLFIIFFGAFMQWFIMASITMNYRIAN